MEYYLKWRGFGNEENSWEPENSLNCSDLIQKFNAKNSKSTVSSTAAQQFNLVAKGSEIETVKKVSGFEL